MLVDEHADGNATGVEAVQEVLDVLVGDRVLRKGLLVLYDALGHRGNHVVVPVPDGHQGVDKPREEGHKHAWCYILVIIPDRQIIPDLFYSKIFKIRAAV